ncbi:MAG: alanine:cation symporter family protein [Bdellovibrionales bacterium]|nr:alanine:cation symporter family protein [Bdellovibrionales bacterium]
MKFITLLLLTLSPWAAQASSGSLINNFFGHINEAIASIFFFDVLFFMDGVSLPLTVAWLVCGSLLFTFYFRFINFRALWHAINITRGHYDKEGDDGEVSHFEALTTALSATVGLGNIAGVAVAVSLGGPGATFWMIVAGLIGMSAKFTECSLAMIYRERRPDGHIMGGPMEYLSKGLAEMGQAKLGKVLAFVFSFLCIGGSFGGGSSFQVNQSLNAISQTIPFFADHKWAYGLIMSVLVGIVIIGGIKRIANVAERIVPTMCGIYIAACLYILVVNYSLLPEAISTIFSSAFTSEAGFGGLVGVLVTGFKRAAFSNEAGVGSAPIAHSAAKSEYPIQEGLVALLEPFIDTVVICTMTALVIVITGAYANPDYQSVIESQQGAALTSMAMGQVIPWFPYVLSLSVVLFAFSTIISWSYYGERCFSFIFSEKYSMVYRGLLLVVVFLGAITTSTTVLEFGDLMILGMAFPNILGILFLIKKVRSELDTYWGLYRSGKLEKS